MDNSAPEFVWEEDPTLIPQLNTEMQIYFMSEELLEPLSCETLQEVPNAPVDTSNISIAAPEPATPLEKARKYFNQLIDTHKTSCSKISYYVRKKVPSYAIDQLVRPESYSHWTRLLRVSTLVIKILLTFLAPLRTIAGRPADIRNYGALLRRCAEEGLRPCWLITKRELEVVLNIWHHYLQRKHYLMFFLG